ncbi:MAG: hypothetical protein IBJ03_11920 [Gemmatimonadaceae bacterium]|nr:hypothetical protein [Gemmatimonadaceae bacterium]
MDRSDAVPEKIPTGEVGFAALARLVPSSAGYYLDETGSMVIRVRDRDEFEAARSAYSTAVSMEQRSYARGGVRIVTADYSYGYLAKQREAVFENLFGSVRGVTSLDLNEARNRVVIGIDKSMAAQASAQLEEAIVRHGLDRQAIEFKPEEPMRPAAGSSSFGRRASMLLPSNLDGVFTTLVGGINIHVSATDPMVGNNGADGECSLGFTTTYTPAGGGASYPAIVTNTHCTQIWGAPDSTALRQGPLGARTYFGYSTVDPHKTYCAGNWCRMADAALFKITSGSIDVGLIARTAPGSINLDAASPYFVVKDVATSSLPMGTTYHRIGHTTGWVTGITVQTCIDHHLGYAWPDQYVTRCGDTGTASAQDGDSGGSVFVRLDSNNVRLIGITVGNNGTAPGSAHLWSPYDRIVANLGGTFQVVRPATLLPPSTIAGSVSSIPGTAFVCWSSASGASEYELQGEDWQQQCDPYWGCNVVNVGTWKVRVVGTSYTDTRSIFHSVVPSGTPAYTYTKYRVLSKNPMTGSFSLLGDSVRFAHY